MKSEDIAKLAGVSRGTVSRVLNGKSDVAHATREKIEKIIKEQEYTPNAFARKLAGKPVEIIGFFVSNISEYRERSDYTIKWWSYESPYFIRIMTSFLTAAKKRGFNLLIDIINNEEELNTIEAYFKSGIISGAAFMNFDENVSVIDRCIKKGYNIALIDQKRGNSNFTNAIFVNADDENGGYLATCELIKNGHKKIAHVHGTKRVLSAKLRIQGYKRALKECGIAINKDYLIDGEYNEYATYLATKKLLENNKDDLPTAIFFANDVMAVGGIKAIKEAGLKVKDDISIIGFDNYTFGEVFDMSFASIKAPLEEMSEFAAENLIKSINNEEYLKVFKGQVELIERDSIKDLN